ncbi:MAG: bifunctional 2-C-methyl-D-erythritol 4-phosphate cytidylyltransferase/2-C-methyl-D-erythritol 2,4-cyclodiphosphate synthase [Pseudomonadota bacterium]
MSVHAVIIAAGAGQRAGGETPKQFQILGGKPVYRWSLEAFQAHEAIEQIVVVVPADSKLDIGLVPQIRAVRGGRDRTASVLAGLSALKAADDDIVLIHDAARPGLSQAIISTLIDAMKHSTAAAPALPVSDALKRKSGDKLKTVSRDAVYRVQTPQAFRCGEIEQTLTASNASFVDDLAAIEEQGGKVTLIEGHEDLSKITWPGDVARMEKLLSQTVILPRVGTGFDVHAFGEGDHVTLCGLAIPHSNGLKGHSDADVAWHTLTDAILGALALGDIGDHFPPSDPQWKGADSGIFLIHAAELAAREGYAIAHCDITIICEAPKIGPHKQAMRENTARLLDLPLSSVSVKATTTERLGFTGRGEGIAAQAACTLVPLSAQA